MIQKTIKKIQEKPRQVRERYQVLTVVVIGVILLVFWIGFIVVKRIFFPEPKVDRVYIPEEMRQTFEEIDQGITEIKDNYKDVQEAGMGNYQDAEEETEANGGIPQEGVSEEGTEASAAAANQESQTEEDSLESEAAGTEETIEGESVEAETEKEAGETPTAENNQAQELE